MYFDHDGSSENINAGNRPKLHDDPVELSDLENQTPGRTPDETDQWDEQNFGPAEQQPPGQV